MKGIFYDLNFLKAVLRKLHLGGQFALLKYREDWPEPRLQFPNQVLVKTLLGGICGTDIAQIDVDITYFVSIMANPAKPFPMGHELVGRVEEVGGEVHSLRPGDRVVFEPIPYCEAYGFKPCEQCAQGHWETCQCLAGVGDGSPLEQQYGGQKHFGGFGGGGWCERLVGFEKQFFKVPDNVPDDVAVLTEPFAVGIHAALRHLPKDTDTAMVVGAGIIGLLTIAAIRACGSKCRLIALTRHAHQTEMALRLGATEAIQERNQQVMTEKIAAATGGPLFKPTLGQPVIYSNGGPAVIFDCVATERSLDDDLRLIKANGTLVIVGVHFAKTKRVDWAVTPYKEITVIGSMMYGIESFCGERRPTFDLALEFMAKDPDRFGGLVTHKFPIEKQVDAFQAFRGKTSSRAIKVAFDFRGQTPE